MPFGAKMSEMKLSRRDFLKLTRTALLTGSVLLGLGGLVRFLSYQSQPPAPTEFDLGPASDYAQGSRTILPDLPVLLVHGDDGFIALSLVCTHLGCTLESRSDGFACPCHGSRFDLLGKVKRGPASKPLASMRVEIGLDGNLHLYIV
jgi:cytochrome b6-f complex iron-sulfur subunit